MSDYLSTLQARLDDPKIPYQKVVLAVVLGVSAFESLIGSRQKPYLDPARFPRLPAALRPFLSSPDAEQTYRKSQAYARHKLQYASVTSVLALVESCVLLTNLASPLWSAAAPAAPAGGALRPDWTLLRGVWDVSAQILPGRIVGSSELVHTASFIAVMNVLGTVLGVPQGLYKNFVLEERHGFNKMTYATFVKDLFKGLALSFALEIPLTVALIALIHWVGQSAILRLVAYVLAFSTVLVVVLVPLGPYVIMPLFNTFTPLEPDHAVYPRVKALAEKVGFPCDRIYVIDGSKRSSHSNAFVTGIPGLQKQIVIYDTLLEKASPEQVEAILAHELAHWKFSHIVYLLVTALTQIAFSLSIFTLFLSNESLLSSFGFHPSTISSSLTSTLSTTKHVVVDGNERIGPTVVSLFLASTLFSPLSAFLGFVTNSITRRLEYEADRFAVSLGQDTANHLKEALVGIHEKNLAVYAVDPVYSAWNHNHPTLVERLEALDQELDKVHGPSAAAPSATSSAQGRDDADEKKTN